MDPQLQRLIDIEEIRRVVYRYFYAADSGNMDFVLSCFTDDVVQDLNGGMMHIEGIEQVRSWIDKTFVIRTVQLHTVSNIDVDVHGDTAHSETRVLAFLVDPDLSTFQASAPPGGGQHKIMCRGTGLTDDWVRDNGAWRIKHRFHRAFWQYEVEAQDIEAHAREYLAAMSR